MSAIVTGVKTHNGVISQGPDGERGRRDGTPTKTVLEYAEEHGLRVDVIAAAPTHDALVESLVSFALRRAAIDSAGVRPSMQRGSTRRKAK